MKKLVIMAALGIMLLIVSIGCGQGQQGPRGPEGPIGETGRQGDPGVQGAIGPAGPQGPQGTQGPQGSPGDKGNDGIQGSKGDTGEAGTPPSKEELFALIREVMTPSPTPTLVPGSYQPPDQLFAFAWNAKAGETKDIVDVFEIADPEWGHPGCPKGSEIFGQSAQGDRARCKADHEVLLEWIQGFSREKKLPSEKVSWEVYETFVVYEGPWPMPEETRKPAPRFFVTFEVFAKEGSGNIILTVFPREYGGDGVTLLNPVPACPVGDTAQRKLDKDGNTNYLCVVSPEDALVWLQRFTLIENLPPRTEWGKIYAIFPALYKLPN